MIAFYVRQPVAPVVIFELLRKRDLATYGGRSLLEAFSNPLRFAGNSLWKNADQSPLTQNPCQARSGCASNSRPRRSVVTDRLSSIKVYSRSHSPAAHAVGLALASDLE